MSVRGGLSLALLFLGGFSSAQANQLPTRLRSVAEGLREADRGIALAFCGVEPWTRAAGRIEKVAAYRALKDKERAVVDLALRDEPRIGSLEESFFDFLKLQALLEQGTQGRLAPSEFKEEVAALTERLYSRYSCKESPSGELSATYARQSLAAERARTRRNAGDKPPTP